MTDRQSTHGTGCWGWGPKHYECAVREIKALRAEVATWEGLHASEVQVRQRWQARAERLAEALREWWSAHRPVRWTEDQHRACPHVNLPTDTDKALAEALLRDQEEGK